MVVDPWWFACCGMYKEKCYCPCVKVGEGEGEGRRKRRWRWNKFGVSEKARTRVRRKVRLLFSGVVRQISCRLVVSITTVIIRIEQSYPV
jgi:hypothetical protein